MPRATFGLDALTGATPGLSKLAQAFAGGNGAYQQGYEGELGNRSKIAQAMAAAAASQAKADQDNSETNIVRSRPDLIDENIALEAGTTLPLVRAFQQYTRTGVMPTRQLQGPADEAGNGPGVAPVLEDTGLQSKIAQAMRRSLPMRTNVKDTNVEDFAKAAGLYQGQDLTNDVLNGARTPGQVGAAQAAAGGKPLYHFDSSGLVGDLFGGGLNESSGRAQSVTGKEVALGKQATAGAAENYAQAEAARANAAKSRMEIDQGGKTGQVQVVTDGNGNITLLNKATGVARGAVGPDGQPLHGKAGALNGEQANALGFANRMQASSKILGELADKGVLQPSRVKQVADSVPVIGGGLGALANGLASAEQQQVEQAQRDFINAVLRRESGAAIGQNEFANAAQQYFVQPNDKPPAIKQKREAVQRAIQSMLAAVPQGMRALPDVPGLPPQGGATPTAAAPPAGNRPPLSSFQR
ncbi:hypothetical protein [Rhizobacter sp. OV335]|uniref:hypothetical protein n=1 Tax=Rhizobacter sp. OV335 TaxID=1500264 RepID=UPI000916FAE0|nr:hypothetical protein [Rhizobacter sp. OV335]SHN40005.1 hypothetical protein SAMN02787076_06151 [Rhizobacter sp. OV335]